MKANKTIGIGEEDCKAIMRTVALLESINSRRCWSVNEIKEIYDKCNKPGGYEDGLIKVCFDPFID